MKTNMFQSVHPILRCPFVDKSPDGLFLKLCESPSPLMWLNNPRWAQSFKWWPLITHISLRVTAVRCDSIEECHDRLDELGCESEIINIPYTLLIIALLTLVSIDSQKNLKRCFLKSMILRKSLKLKNKNGTEANPILKQKALLLNNNLARIALR